jgi:hypothetical protein
MALVIAGRVEAEQSCWQCGRLLDAAPATAEPHYGNAIYSTNKRHRSAMLQLIIGGAIALGNEPMPDAVMLTLIVLAVLAPAAYADFCRRLRP